MKSAEPSTITAAWGIEGYVPAGLSGVKWHRAWSGAGWDDLVAWLDVERPGARKNERYVVPAQFVAPEGGGGRGEAAFLRRGEYASARWAAALDWDGGQGADWEAEGRAALEALEMTGVAHVWHTTWSRTEENFRFRVWVPLSRAVGPQEWPAVLADMRAVLGGSGWDTSADDFVRVMFAPAAEQEGLYEWGVGSGGAWPVPDEVEGVAVEDVGVAEEGDLAAIREYEADTEGGALAFADTLRFWENRLREVVDGEREPAAGSWHTEMLFCQEALHKDALRYLGEEVTPEEVEVHREAVTPEEMWQAEYREDLRKPARVADAYEKAVKALRREAKEREVAEGVAAKGGVVDEVQAELLAGDPKLPLSVRMFNYIMATHEVFAAKDTRDWMLHTRGERPVPLDESAVTNACWGLGYKKAVFTQESKKTLALLKGFLLKAPTRSVVDRVAVTKAGEYVVDLRDRENTKCVVVSKTGWEVRDAPPEGLVLPRLQEAVTPLVVPERGGSLELLRPLLDCDDRNWLLIRGWLRTVFMADITRPGLAFYGPSGSAKSTRAALVTGIVDPLAELNEFGGVLADNMSDNQVAALNSLVYTLDNLSAMERKHSDFLATVITGAHVKKRKLYSDTESVVTKIRRPVVLTAITEPYGMQDDVRDRLIPLHFPAREGNSSILNIQREWQALMPKLLGAVFDAMVESLAAPPAPPEPVSVRMVDYLHRLNPEEQEAYVAAYHGDREDRAREDPFVSLVVHFVEEHGPFEGLATELWSQLNTMRDITGEDHGWFPKDARVLGQALTRDIHKLTALGVGVSKGKRTERGRLTRLVKL